MPSLDWTAFYNLPGSKSINFENLCRALIRLHYGQHGKFGFLKNQPGVEFHLQLSGSCPLGAPPRWYGWQCKLHKRTTAGDLRSASRKDIEDSLMKAEKYLPKLTDWVLWTPYTLSKKDQTWFNSLQTKYTLHQWASEEIDTYLNDQGLMLRGTYFGELILTPNELAQRHNEAIQPIRERWLAPVHQSVDAERAIRRMLGEPGAWKQMADVGRRLEQAVKTISNSYNVPPKIQNSIAPFTDACSAFADTLINFHQILADGYLENIQQTLRERKALIDTKTYGILRQLRSRNLSIALDATNALSDMRIAQEMLNEIEECLVVGLVAVIADAGDGKTQMAAQLTSPQDARPAGILLHGRALQKGQTLDDLARHFLINGTPLSSMEKLLASLDAAGKRDGCRLPVVIDGLNEAEDPRDWKAPLAILNEIIKRYPNVLVVCTLRTGERRRKHITRDVQSTTNPRESFAVMALPDGMRRIESEGFGGDVDEAISKYFSYFKINAKDVAIPVEFLQHPLNLRIFCEVTNSKRKTVVRVNYVPKSLTLLFEKYVLNVCERISQMTNLSCRSDTDDIIAAIYKLGLQLWKSKKRWIDETAFRDKVSDTNRLWDSSIVNLLSQEGIIFRNPGNEPGMYTITPVYDALGGYIVADSLLIKYRNDSSFTWFKKSEVIQSFTGDDSHPLASDIFNSLVALAPHRMHGRQLWREVPDTLQKAALMSTTMLDPKYLDEETVAALMELFQNDLKKRRTSLLYRLNGTRSAPDHPLNSEFQDSVLRSLSVSERDLSWTEWVRKTRSDRFNELLSVELRWKEDVTSRSLPDHLRARWIMWLLTSTDRELRDVATRALYWFGRGDPEALFEASLRALEINDPYIPERMIAASYGVAMARHVDIGDQAFIRTILVDYARKLFELLFAENAPFSTTHMLLREFASRTIELAVFHNPKFFSDKEIERSKPPFYDGGLRDWGQSKSLEKGPLGHGSPFYMDFENYSIGRLVPDRGNYNYDHEEYQKVRAQILWRVEQLGWSSELFGEIDRSVAKGQYRGRIGSDKYKTDRYGKKYSWIAYFEMSGLLHDQGVLKNWAERTSSVDIDPSFPERVSEGTVVKSDILGDAEMEMKDWIKDGPLPNILPYLRLEKLLEEEVPWIALDGFMIQQDEKRGRKSFCFIRSFLVSNKDAASFTDHLSQQNLGDRWLPEKPEVLYTFGGEIPWCDCFKKNGLSEFSFVIKEETIKVKQTQKELYLDGKKLEWPQIDFIRRRFSDDAAEELHEEQLIRDKDLERIEIREEPIECEEVKIEHKKFDALIPVCDFAWEGYQTAASDAGGATTLTKEIAYDLKLLGQPQTFDLYTAEGLRATFNVSDHNGDDYNNHQSMFYFKEDLLIQYLKKNKLSLVWAIWGEREYSSDQLDRISHGPDRPEQPYAEFSFIEQYECPSP